MAPPARVQLDWKTKMPAVGGPGLSGSVALDGQVLVGRTPECAINTSHDAQCSRLHAIFRREGDKIFVEDQNSSNGTWVRVKRQELSAGDVVRVGDMWITVVTS